MPNPRSLAGDEKQALVFKSVQVHWSVGWFFAEIMARTRVFPAFFSRPMKPKAQNKHTRNDQPENLDYQRMSFVVNALVNMAMGEF